MHVANGHAPDALDLDAPRVGASAKSAEPKPMDGDIMCPSSCRAREASLPCRRGVSVAEDDWGFVAIGGPKDAALAEAEAYALATATPSSVASDAFVEDLVYCSFSSVTIHPTAEQVDPSPPPSDHGSTFIDATARRSPMTPPGPRTPRKTRPTLAGRCLSACAGTRRGVKASSSKMPTTVAELYDFIIDGRRHARLYIDDIVDDFMLCKTSGLDKQLAMWVHHLALRDDVLPEDISSSEFRRLCCLLAEEPLDEVGVQLARLHVARARTQPDTECVNDKLKENLNRNAFKKLVWLVTQLLRVDEAYVVTHFVWAETGYFEMPDTLFKQLMFYCVRELVTCVNDAKLTLPEFTGFLNMCGIIDETAQTGLPIGVMSVLFCKTARDMPGFRARYRDQRLRYGSFRWQLAGEHRRQGTPAATLFLIGKIEIAILVDRLFHALPRAPDLMFRSPLQLCVLLISRMRSSR